VLLLVSVGALFGRGLNLSLDFTGGVVWSVPSERSPKSTPARSSTTTGSRANRAKVQELTSDSGPRWRDMQVGDQPDEVRQAVQEALADEGRRDRRGRQHHLGQLHVGASITEKAVTALVVFLVLVSAFISWRLEWRMASAAIIAMLHDVLLSVGVYSLFGFEVTPPPSSRSSPSSASRCTTPSSCSTRCRRTRALLGRNRMPYADIDQRQR
jgi:preprotein translocase subunit SecF